MWAPSGTGAATAAGGGPSASGSTATKKARCVTTRLLTLNVHDALTFDGTEVVLHPHLFGNPHSNSSIHNNTTNNTIHATNTTAAAAAAVTTIANALSGPSLSTTNNKPPVLLDHHRQTSSQSGPIRSGPMNQVGPGPVPGVLTVGGGSNSIESSSSSTTTANTRPTLFRQGSSHRSTATARNPGGPNASNTPPIMASSSGTGGGGLVVGDMIEIRVWDAKPGHTTASYNNRYTSSASTAGTTVGTSNFPNKGIPPVVRAKDMSTITSSSNHNTANNEVAPPALLSTRFRTHSVEHVGPSMMTTTPLATPSGSPASTVTKGPRRRTQTLPSDTMMAEQQQPPPPPPSQRRNLMLAQKPPLVQRTITPNAPPRGPNISSSRHTRDVSDLTTASLMVLPSSLDDGYPSTPEIKEVPSSNTSESSYPLLGIPTLSDDDETDTLQTEHKSPRIHWDVSPSLVVSQDTDEDNNSTVDNVIYSLSQTHTQRNSFVMKVTEKSLTSSKDTSRTQISLLKAVAELYQLSSFDMVTVSKIDKADEALVLESVAADFVMMTIKDQFLSRGELHYFQESLFGRWVYEGERLGHDGTARAVAKEIRLGKESAKSAIITKDTKFTFRSRSSRVIWLVQISSEMWDYASPYESEEKGFGSTFSENDDSACEIYFDKFVSFLYRLFKKWKNLEVTHSLTVVFFSRTYLGAQQEGGMGIPRRNDSKSALNTDVDGSIYEDHYKTVIENETRTDWDSLVLRIKKEFIRYPMEVGWNFASNINRRVPSTALQGNLLEAINVTLNLLQLHYMDRDLRRTGNSLMVVTAGSGVFEVDKGLAGITKQRMMDNGIGSDMLSLGLPPLHVAPFFLYKEESETHEDEKQGFEDWKQYFELPHWMHLSFANYDHERDHPENTEKKKASHLSNPHTRNESKQRSTSVSPEPQKPYDFHVGANGFLVRENINRTANPIRGNSAQPRDLLLSSGALATLSAGSSELLPNRAQLEQRHLISGRDFEDILEACRPRNIGITIGGMPSSLVSILQTWNNSNLKTSPTKKSLDIITHKKVSDTSSSDEVESQVSIIPRPRSFTRESFDFKEWGAVDFDECFPRKQIKSPSNISTAALANASSPTHNSMTAASERVGSHSNSDVSSHSPASSFTSHLSHLLGRSAEKSNTIPPRPGSYVGSLGSKQGSLTGIHIQPSPDFPIPTFSARNEVGDDNTDMALYKKNRSDDSLSTIGPLVHDSQKKLDASMKILTESNHTDSSKVAVMQSPDILRKFMASYDSDIFSSTQKTRNISSWQGNDDSAPITNISVPQTESMSPRKRNLRQSPANQGFDRVSSAGPGMFISSGSLSTGQPSGGIGAALSSYSGNNHLMSNNSQHRESSNMLRILGSRRVKGVADQTYSHTTGSYRGPQSFGNYAISQTTNPPDMLSVSPRHLVPMTRDMKNQTSESSAWGHHVHIGSGSSDMSYRASGQTSEPVQLKRGRSGSGGPSEISPTSYHQDSNVFSKSPGMHRDRKKESSAHGTSRRNSSSAHHNSIKRRHQNSRKHVPPSSASRRKPWVLNPFRQKDEDEVLATRTHNRRRWSHVFPPGEIEFKRDTGPNWKSLCQPAILPLTIDFHPSPQELNNPEKFHFQFYDLLLSATDHSYYTSHSELLMEMVRQRLVQDFQIVPQSIIKESKRRGEIERLEQAKAKKVRPREGSSMVRRPVQGRLFHSKDEDDGKIQHTLSMGHKIQVLTYDPTSDKIEVIQYNASFAQNDKRNIQTYRYMVWSHSSQSYKKVAQTFVKYTKLYRWNKVDNLICGDTGRTLSSGTRYRRLSFGMIPDRFLDPLAEQEYISRFHRLLEYVSKLQPKDAINKIQIKIVTTKDSKPDSQNELAITRRSAEDLMERFIVRLGKGKRDKYEWMEMLMDPIFDTRRTYRIMFHWLVGSAAKVEAQIQLLQRRCTQFGLKLIQFPQSSVSSNLFLNPFQVPTMIPVRESGKALEVEAALVDRFYFVHDGIRLMERADVKTMGEFHPDFDFPVNRRFPVRQYIHHSGTIFIRLMTNEKGWVLFIVFSNHHRIGGDEEMKSLARNILTTVQQHIITNVDGNSESG